MVYRVKISCLLGCYIILENVSFVRVNSVTFQSCDHMPHGALQLVSVQCSVIINSRWCDSQSSAIVTHHSDHTTIDDCQIKETLCSKCQGGGICTIDGEILLTGHTVIHGNRILTPGEGGGLYAFKANILLSGNLTLIRNMAWNGGGIFISSCVLSSTFNSVLILTGNSGTNEGGGLWGGRC